MTIVQFMLGYQPHFRMSLERLAESCLKDIGLESDTLLRTEDELLAEVMRELGFQKRGSKIVATLTSSIRVARSGR